MRVLMPLPSHDFDPTEAGVSWKILHERGHEIHFATPDGRPATPDERMMTGRGLFVWRPILRAGRHGREACEQMMQTDAFQRPLSYTDLRDQDFDALVLPGGHAEGMKTYLASEVLQRFVGSHMGKDKPTAAICHGVVLAARSTPPDSDESALHGRKTTGLTRSMELSAWAMTALWLGGYYRTYPTTVQDEVESVLASPDDFAEGPFAVFRDSPEKLSRGFTVRDGNYLSARWPGDAHRFATEFCDILEASQDR